MHIKSSRKIILLTLLTLDKKINIYSWGKKSLPNKMDLNFDQILNKKGTG